MLGPAPRFISVQRPTSSLLISSPMTLRIMNRHSLALTAILVAAAPLALMGCNGSDKADGGDASAAIARPPVNESIIKAQEAAAKGQEYALGDRPIEAIDQYRRAIALYREFPAAWNNLGLLLMNQNRGMEASEAFKTAGDLAPTDPRPIKNLGDVWQKQLYFDEAYRRYEQALERDPNFQPALQEAIRIDSLRDTRTEVTAARIQRALMQETDPAWREFLLRQKVLADRNVREHGYPRTPDRGPKSPNRAE